jgi:hypothetical protein
MNRRMLSMIVGATLALSSGLASAQQPSAQDQAAAEGLFSEGKKLMADGKYPEACPKFEESQRLDPAPGTQFNLGECYERLGKTASAWALFLNVAAAAKSAGMADREKIARDRAAALEPKLAKLTIVAPQATPETEIKRDNVIVGRAQYGSAVAVDPGSHTITASAPGMETWTKSIEVAAEGATLSVPPLVAAAAAAASPNTPLTPPPAEEKPGLGTQRALAIAAAGVGVVGIGIGSVFGLSGMSKVSDSEAHCTGNLCDQTGVGLREDAVSAGNISTIAFSVGLVALAGAAVLWFTAPSRSSSRATAAPRFLGARGTSFGGVQ